MHSMLPLLVCLSLSLSLACSDKADDTALTEADDGGLDDGGADGGADGGSTDDPTWTPSTVRLRAGFGWDPVSGQTAAYVVHNVNTITPWVELTLEDEAAGERCAVTVHSDGTSGEADWSAEVSADGQVQVSVGVDLPGALSAEDACDDLDPDLWPAGASALATDFDWGLGFGGLSARVADPDDAYSVQAWITESQGADAWSDTYEPSVIGGFVRWSALADAPGQTAVHGFAQALVVDEDFKLVEGSGGSVVAYGSDVVLADGGPPAAAYIIELIEPFDPAVMLGR